MGLLHAAYGLGAFAAPLAATPFAAFSNHRWAFIYIGKSASYTHFSPAHAFGEFKSRRASASALRSFYPLCSNSSAWKVCRLPLCLKQI